MDMRSTPLDTGGRGRLPAPQVAAFVAGFSVVFALIVLLALPIWVLLRIPGALVAPDSYD